MQLATRFKEMNNNPSLRLGLSELEAKVVDMTSADLDSIEISKELNITLRDVDDLRVSIFVKYSKMAHTAQSSESPFLKVVSI